MNFSTGTKHLSLCEDGVVRTATVIRSPDTFSSVPTRVVAFGKTVTGFVTIKNGQVCFIADNWRKNASVISRRLSGTQTGTMLSGVERENLVYYQRLVEVFSNNI